MSGYQAQRMAKAILFFTMPLFPMLVMSLGMLYGQLINGDDGMALWLIAFSPFILIWTTYYAHKSPLYLDMLERFKDAGEPTGKQRRQILEWYGIRSNVRLLHYNRLFQFQLVNGEYQASIAGMPVVLPERSILHAVAASRVYQSYLFVHQGQCYWLPYISENQGPVMLYSTRPYQESHHYLEDRPLTEKERQLAFNPDPPRRNIWMLLACGLYAFLLPSYFGLPSFLVAWGILIWLLVSELYHFRRAQAPKTLAWFEGIITRRKIDKGERSGFLVFNNYARVMYYESRNRLLAFSVISAPRHWLAQVKEDIKVRFAINPKTLALVAIDDYQAPGFPWRLMIQQGLRLLVMLAAWSLILVALLQLWHIDAFHPAQPMFLITLLVGVVPIIALQAFGIYRYLLKPQFSGELSRELQGGKHGAV